MPESVAAAFAHGADWLQIRERELEGTALLVWARELAEAAARGAERAGRSPVIVVNRRLDIALSLGADGAHLGFDAVSLSDARAVLGTDTMLGVSAHSAREVEAAARAGADYVHLAPLFDPLSKPASRPPLGLAAVSAAARSGVDVIAQGGVDVDNAREIVRSGAAGVAVTGAVLLADDPGVATGQLRDALDAAQR